MTLTSSPLPSSILGRIDLFEVASFQATNEVIDSNNPFLPFLLLNRLVGDSSAANEVIKSLDFEIDSIKEGNTNLNWVTRSFPENTWQMLPIQSHRLAEPTQERGDAIKDALKRLNTLHPDSANILNNYVSNIVWLELDPKHRSQNDQITSSSFPILPWTIFVSDKAMHHIPPNTVANKASHRFLAENIFHEAVHQQVNALLLSTDIFVQEYDSSTSPKIEIAWRLNQGIIRNQHWELDRTFHATAVYIELCGFRLRELLSEQDDPRKSYEYDHFLVALREAAHALTYLCDHLERYPEYFTSDGLEVLGSLLHNRHVAISRCATELLL